MCPLEISCASDDFQFILCDTDATAFYDLVLGCQLPIYPPTTMIDITNKREHQYMCEYLFTHSVTSSVPMLWHSNLNLFYQGYIL